jgi:phage terminase large subunit-like protein
METFTRHARGGATGMRVVHSFESEEFMYYAYSVDGDGKRMHNSAFYSRPKGCDKSGMASRVALFEALGPCRFEGWAKGGETIEILGETYEYEAGEAMGTWVTSPLVRIMATEEDQTGNTFDSIYYNLHPDHGQPLSQYVAYGMRVNKEKVFLPFGGEIVPSTASAASKDGGLETFVVFDESHRYNNGPLRNMHGVVTNNVTKRRDEGSWYLETTTMYATGENSIAEQQYNYMEKILEGKARRPKMLFDHRYGEIAESDMSDDVKLAAALRDAYGEVAIHFDEDGNQLPYSWVDVENIIDDIYNPVNEDAKNPRRFFLNVPTALSGNSWLQPEDLNGVMLAEDDPKTVVKVGETITLGFDGSLVRDATVLVGCRVSDGYTWVIYKEERPDTPESVEWTIDLEAFDAKVDEAFRKYKVVAFFADPAKWETHIEMWQRKYGDFLLTHASNSAPIKFYTTGVTNMVRALDRMKTAIILKRDIKFDNDKFLKRQLLNGVMRERSMGVLVFKITPSSMKTIDSIYACTFAYEARARFLGLTNEFEAPVTTRSRPRRARNLI